MKLVWSSSTILPGIYSARIVDIEQEEDIADGKSSRVTFEIQDGWLKGENISDSFYFHESGYVTSKYPLGRIVQRLLGPFMDGDEVELKNLIGKDCWITIEMKEEKIEVDIRLFPCVVDVQAIDKAKQPS